MNARTTGIAFLVALIGSNVTATAADDASDVGAKVRAATAAAISYVVAITGGRGFLATEVAVNPDRIRTTYSSQDGTVEIVEIGHAIYRRIGDGPWQTRWSERIADGSGVAPFMAAGARFVLLGDRSENGMEVGAFTVVTPTKRIKNDVIPEMTVTCTYDKATYRPRRCAFPLRSGDVSTMTYENWDAPVNRFEPPAGVPEPTRAPRPS